MKKKPRTKMERGQRAKQFLPYDALEGLGEELLAIEKEQEAEQLAREPGHGKGQAESEDCWPEE